MILDRGFIISELETPSQYIIDIVHGMYMKVPTKYWSRIQIHIAKHLIHSTLQIKFINSKTCISFFFLKNHNKFFDLAKYIIARSILFCLSHTSHF